MRTLDFIRDIRFYQHSEGYRVSVDALLLYDFINTPRLVSIADIGCGSGIIGLLLAKRYTEAEVLLIEIQKGLAGLARDNILLNGLEDRVRLINEDVRDVIRRQDLLGAFDAIAANPPFRRVSTGIVSPNDERAAARHELNLTLSHLLKASSLMLRHHGRLFMIYLPERLSEAILKMRENSFEVKRIRFVHSFVDSPAKMTLIEAVKNGRSGMKVINPLVLYKDKDTYSEEVLRIYQTYPSPVETSSCEDSSVEQ